MVHRIDGGHQAALHAVGKLAKRIVFLSFICIAKVMAHVESAISGLQNHASFACCNAWPMLFWGKCATSADDCAPLKSSGLVFCDAHIDLLHGTEVLGALLHDSQKASTMVALVVYISSACGAYLQFACQCFNSCFCVRKHHNFWLLACALLKVCHFFCNSSVLVIQLKIWPLPP